MADERTLARRYARALLGVAEERKEIDRVETDLREFAQTWHAAPELRTLMGHPSVPREKKKDALETALKGKVSDLTIRFLALLLEKSRLEIIEDVAEQFGEAADEVRGVAKARVTTFMALSDGHRQKLVERLRAFTARPNVVLDEVVDPSILGGIVVRIGDQVLDGSVKGKLRALREKLTTREGDRAQKAAQAAAEALGS